MKIRKVTKYRGKVYWQLDAGVIDGKRYQKYFRTSELAQKALSQFKDKRKKEGDAGMSLSEADRIRFLEAKNTLTTAGATIEEAVKFFLSHAKPSEGPLPVADLMTACLRAKRQENKREKYLSQLKCSMLSFCCAGNGRRSAHEIKASDVEHWLHRNEWAEKTKAVYLTDLRTMFAWGISKGFLSKNPCESIRPPKIEDKPVAIYDVPTCEKLLAAAMHTDHELGMLGYIAIGLFAGVRPDERLKWSHVHLEDRFLEVPAAVSKTRKRRIVDISENLARWLQHATSRLHGRIAPVNWLVKHRAKLLKAAQIEVWPHDVLRHCFASYHLAQHGSAERTSLQLGHHNTQMLFQHYREVVRPKDAKAFWEIAPPSIYDDGCAPAARNR